MKDLLRTSDLTEDDLVRLLDLSTGLKFRPFGAHDELNGQIVVLYFTKPSTRTRLSFSAAAARLGATAVIVGPTELQLGRGETIEDTARVISGYAAALVVRTYADDDVRRLADAASIPVINGLTDGHHPCQSLADLLTLQEHFGALYGLRVAYLGDGNNVAHSLTEACALAGVDITIASPRGYEPDPAVVARAALVAEANGSRIAVTDDPESAVDGVDAVYTDVWLSMGDPEDQRGDRRAALAPYQVNARLMCHAAPHAVFLHCLPAHRGDEVTDDVIGGERSLVFTQADNRLHTATALLLALHRGDLKGTRLTTAVLAT
jgi:ornithine carbamoyltransferase